jgi:hypothetical protein
MEENPLDVLLKDRLGSIKRLLQTEARLAGFYQFLQGTLQDVSLI